MLALCAGAANVIVISEQLLARVEQVYDAPARQRVEAWAALLARQDLADDASKLEAVNRFFNAMRFRDDSVHWGENDYWATPIEFLGTNGGDCEDFSIAKYFTLRHLGVPEEKLRMVYVKALKLNQAHMVVAYLETPDAEPLVLDNLVPEIKRAGLRRDLKPVYSFNGDGLWLAKERGLGNAPVGKADKLSLWTQLQQRMQSADWRKATS
ncbi:MAG TPA: transglutaminase-like cysteine peptidase [Gammaproteobacteria bacterium]